MSISSVESPHGSGPEVRPARQVYPAAYKLKVLAELDAAGSRSERGKILRLRACILRGSESGANNATAVHSRQ